MALLLNAINEHWLEALVLIAILTGIRRSELICLRWKKNVDLKNNRIMLDKTKSKKRRIVYINKTLLDVLNKLPRRIDTDLLFPEYNGDMVSVAFKRLCKQNGIEDFSWHDLRHCFASYLAMSGCQLRTIQELLGHSDVRMTVRYSHLSPEHLQNAVNTLDSVIRNVGSSNTGEMLK